MWDRISARRRRRARAVAGFAVGTAVALATVSVVVSTATGDADDDERESVTAAGGVPGYRPRSLPEGFEVVAREVNRPGSPAVDFVQVFEANTSDGDPERVVVRQKPAGASTVGTIPGTPLSTQSVEVGSGEGELVRYADGAIVLKWVSPGGKRFELTGQDLTDREVAELTSSFQPRDDAPGLEPVPGLLQTIVEGEVADEAARKREVEIIAAGAENSESAPRLNVSLRAGSRVDTELFKAVFGDVRSFLVGDINVLVATVDPESNSYLLQWQPMDGVVTEAQSRGLPLPELLGFVGGLQLVGDEEWADLLAESGVRTDPDPTQQQDQRWSYELTLDGQDLVLTWSVSGPSDVLEPVEPAPLTICASLASPNPAPEQICNDSVGEPVGFGFVVVDHPALVVVDPDGLEFATVAGLPGDEVGPERELVTRNLWFGLASETFPELSLRRLDGSEVARLPVTWPAGAGSGSGS